MFLINLKTFCFFNRTYLPQLSLVTAISLAPFPVYHVRGRLRSGCAARTAEAEQHEKEKADLLARIEVLKKRAEGPRLLGADRGPSIRPRRQPHIQNRPSRAQPRQTATSLS